MVDRLNECSSFKFVVRTSLQKSLDGLSFKKNTCQIFVWDWFITVWLILRRDHTLSSDLPLMRFFFISPQQKISSLHTGNETDSEFEVFSKRMTFWNIKSNFICFFLHTRSSSCQLGKCTRKLFLIPLIAMKSGNALDLPLSGISLNTSIVLDCMI